MTAGLTRLASEFSHLGNDQLRRYVHWKWRNLLLLCVFYMFFYLGRLNWGLAIPWVRVDLGLSSSQIGLIAGSMLWTYAVGTLIYGRLADTVGARKLLAAGAIGTCVLNWMTSFGNQFLTVAIPYVLNGFAQSAAFSPGQRMIAQWWPKSQRGFAASAYLAAGGVSTLLVWLISGYYLSHYGWRMAFRIPLLLTLGAGLLYFAFSRDSPRDASLPPYRERSEGISAEAERLPDSAYARFGPYMYLLSRPRFVCFCLAGLLGYVGRFALLTWIPLHYAERIASDLAGLPMATIGLPLGMFAGPIVCGWLSDRAFASKRGPPNAIFNGGAAVLLALIAFLPPERVGPNLWLGFLVVCGFLTFGALGPVFSGALDFGGRKMAGAAAGLTNFFNYIGAGLQGVAIGFLLDVTERNWFLVFLAVAICLVLAGLLALSSRE